MTKKILCIGRALNIFASSKLMDILKHEKKYELAYTDSFEDAKHQLSSGKYDAVIMHGLRIPAKPKRERKLIERYTEPDWTNETKYAPGLGMVEYTSKVGIPVIVISNASPDIQAKAIRLGAKGFFKKDEKKRKIAEALENML